MIFYIVFWGKMSHKFDWSWTLPFSPGRHYFLECQDEPENVERAASNIHDIRILFWPFSPGWTMPWSRLNSVWFNSIQPKKWQKCFMPLTLHCKHFLFIEIGRSWPKSIKVDRNCLIHWWTWILIEVNWRPWSILTDCITFLVDRWINLDQS